MLVVLVFPDETSNDCFMIGSIPVTIYWPIYLTEITNFIASGSNISPFDLFDKYILQVGTFSALNLRFLKGKSVFTSLKTEKNSNSQDEHFNSI